VSVVSVPKVTLGIAAAALASLAAYGISFLGCQCEVWLAQSQGRATYIGAFLSYVLITAGASLIISLFFVWRPYRAPLSKAGVLALVAILLRVIDAQTGLPFYREVRYVVFFSHILVVAAASCFLASWIRGKLEKFYA